MLRLLFLKTLSTFIILRAFSFIFETTSDIYINGKPDKTFSGVSMMQCAHRCRMAGYGYHNFNGESPDVLGKCHCFSGYQENQIQEKEKWNVIKMQDVPQSVKVSDKIVDGGLSEWSPWTTCSKTCGGGSSERNRSCTNPKPESAGLKCQGTTKETKECAIERCPVDGGFSAWSQWETCTKTCGEGMQQQTRSCTNPEPQYGGADCVGDVGQTQECNAAACPTDGGFTEWSPWTTCTKTCGGGSQQQTRSCTNPEPQHGGADCVGNHSKVQMCNTHVCSVNGGLSEWLRWTTCTTTCGGGSQHQTRTCTNPTPQHGGADCVDETSKTQSCKTNECPCECTFQHGDGFSSYEQFAGYFATKEECRDSCLLLRENQPRINGITYSIGSDRNMACYCEYDMTNRYPPSMNWISCFL